jgi:hypothetical protein
MYVKVDAILRYVFLLVLLTQLSSSIRISRFLFRIKFQIIIFILVQDISLKIALIIYRFSFPNYLNGDHYKAVFLKKKKKKKRNRKKIIKTRTHDNIRGYNAI